MSDYHIPVLLKDSVEGLNISSGGIYVDATFGGGGHSAAILKKMDGGRLFAFDQDEDAARNLPEDDRFIFILGNFRFLKNYLNYHGVRSIDGLIADLGVSSHHFNTPERGFSYRSQASLDMRMNQKGSLTAEKIVNEYEIKRMTELFREYGELHQAHRIASAIVEFRTRQRLETTSQLVSCIEPLIPRHSENQFLSKVFQALRIEVNQELASLKEMLMSVSGILKPGGRLVVISYHSLEDRLVKNFMRWGNSDEEPVKDVFGNSYEPYRLITRKPVMAGENEVLINPRARSARLRIAERK
ncbi:MAG: 16S rRNA (cytosine(1402)-N(4))-methyltransferase RsmH [Bacteroidales bacterium]|nr:16S rRNA (cytosine(1402)-N(4))-methyltransferase RsmH [Bacteroidales bacterium]